MDESRLRWKGRIGSLRGLSVLIWIGIAFLLFSVGASAFQTATGPRGPETATVEDLMAGGARPLRYVTLQGDAYYDTGYVEEDSNGMTVALYYLFFDPKSGQALVVRAPSTDVGDWPPAAITLTGIIHSSPAGLQEAVEADLAAYGSTGFQVDPTFYLWEGERPMDFLVALAVLLGSGWLGVLAFVPFLFPTTVFTPRPMMGSTPMPSPRQPGQGVTVTGRLQQIKRLHPSIEPGRRRQRFTNAVGNLVPLDDGRLMIYIHNVVRTQLYGVITVSRQESDWAVFVAKNEPWQIEPGTIYGWKDRPALRFRRMELGTKMDDIYVIFGHPDSQAEFAASLRASGFPVGTGASI